MSESERITEAMSLIADYAVKQQWLPIGRLTFTVGHWKITINGERDAWTQRQNLPAYHAMVEHDEIVSFMIISPFGGTVGGWSGTEEAFIADMKQEINRLMEPA